MGGQGVFNRNRGYSLYEHAAMHISVYTEAFDSCIHRIEYLNENKREKNRKKNNKNMQQQKRLNEVYKATKTKCALCNKKQNKTKSSMSAPIPLV